MITGDRMFTYEVHYKRNEIYFKGVKKGVRKVQAGTFMDAIRIIRNTVPGSYEHKVWVVA